MYNTPMNTATIVCFEIKKKKCLKKPLVLRLNLDLDVRTLFTPSRMYLVARNSTLLQANNKGADQPAHPRIQLALESIMAKPAICKK